MLDAVAVRVVVMSPSSRLSSTPVTVTVWAVSQLLVVNVSDEALRECSVLSAPVMETVTSAVGLASRTTVNVEVEPASVVRRLPEPSVVPVWAMEMPAVSLSVFFRVVETAFDPEKPPVLEAVAVSVVVMSPSSRLSSTPVTVTV